MKLSAFANFFDFYVEKEDVTYHFMDNDGVLRTRTAKDFADVPALFESLYPDYVDGALDDLGFEQQTDDYRDAAEWLGQRSDIQKNYHILYHVVRVIAGLENLEDDTAMQIMMRAEKAKRTKKMHVSFTCMATYDAYIDVPKNLSLSEAINYAKEHVGEIPIGELNYISDSDEIDEENCDFIEEEGDLC